VPRSLTSQRSVVVASERSAFVRRLRSRRDHYIAAGCNYWVFEEKELPGAFLEFIESKDAKTLERALAQAPERGPGGARIYEEVEL
jgi:hypothetical protein